MTISITLTYDSFAAAADALLRLQPSRVSTDADAAADLAGLPRPLPTIAHEDRPDVGAESPHAGLISAIQAHDPFKHAAYGNPFAVAAAPEAAVVPLPPSSVPMPPAATTAPTAAIALIAAPGLDVDAHGLPWDQRIHADAGKGKPRPKIGDGSWRKKRGVDDATMTAVEAELRAAMGASVPVVPTVPAPPAAVVAPTPLDDVPFGGWPALPAVPAVAPTPAVSVPSATSVPPSAAPDATPLTFATLMARIAPPITKNPDSAVIALAILAPYGLTAYGQLPTVQQNDPPLFARIASELTAALGVA